MIWQKTLQILVVDDDEVDRMAIKRNLRQSQTDAEITEAVSCQEALEAIYKQSFDCVFIDYRLGDGNGLDLVQELRRSGIRIPLIALTGQGDEQVAVNLMKAGASDYITKAKIRPDLLHRVLQQSIRLYEAEQEAEKAKQQRENLLAQREELISRMTHDMQTPLLGANRMLELIQDDAFGEIPAAVKAKTAIIIRSNNDLLKMVRDLVEVHTYDIGAKEINCIPVEMRELIQEVLQELSPLAQQSQLTLQLQVVDENLNYIIPVDRLEFKRVLINLVGNSLKFTETGGITISVRGSSPSDASLKITVEDTGVGISLEDQAQLFERFRRGKHKRSNSGLGLYLSRQIVESHKGTITVDSQLGHGTTFTIVLPVSEPS